MPYDRRSSNTLWHCKDSNELVENGSDRAKRTFRIRLVASVDEGNAGLDKVGNGLNDVLADVGLHGV